MVCFVYHQISRNMKKHLSQSLQNVYYPGQLILTTTATLSAKL